MWSDNDTDRDYVNFAAISQTIAEIVLQANGEPVSIGVSGSWGVGKSSMIRLTRREIINKASDTETRKILFVDFNAWLYQGYDDARAALVDVILNTLMAEAASREGVADKVESLFNRLNWLRAAGQFAPAAISLATGLPIGGLVGGMIGLARDAGDDGKVDDPEAAVKQVRETVGSLAGLFDAKKEESPPQQIQALRDEFESLLDDLKVTLVVMVDDLDRCLPRTAIATLEAMRLFLFLRHTAFVIAADEKMIRHAVREHFKGVVDEADGQDLVTNYFDKLIQIPLRVPPLGTQEVRAYMMLLFIEASSIDPDIKDHIRNSTAERLAKSWTGKNVDRDFMRELHQFDPDIAARIDTAQRLAPIMTGAQGIRGNPRLIKRFLNALSLRMAMAAAQGVEVSEAVLAKLLLFERLGEADLYSAIVTEVTGDPNGHSKSLASVERSIRDEKTDGVPEEWQSGFAKEWLLLDPPLGEVDLRGALYIGREHAPILLRADELSTEAQDVLRALLEYPKTGAEYGTTFAGFTRTDRGIIVDRILDEASKERSWPNDLLETMIALAAADETSRGRIVEFLKKRPVSALKAGVIPKLRSQRWSKELFAVWQDSTGLSEPVRKALMAAAKER